MARGAITAFRPRLVANILRPQTFGVYQLLLRTTCSLLWVSKSSYCLKVSVKILIGRVHHLGRPVTWKTLQTEWTAQPRESSHLLSLESKTQSVPGSVVFE